MPDLTLQELYKQLQESEQRSPAHEELIQAIENLHQASLPFRRFRGRKQLSQCMKEAAQTYLNGKLVNGQVPANASDYTKHRIEIAQQVLEYGRQGETIQPEETRKAEANEAEARKQIAERKAVQAADAPKTPEIPKIPQV